MQNAHQCDGKTCTHNKAIIIKHTDFGITKRNLDFQFFFANGTISKKINPNGFGWTLFLQLALFTVQGGNSVFRKPNSHPHFRFPTHLTVPVRKDPLEFCFDEHTTEIWFTEAKF